MYGQYANRTPEENFESISIAGNNPISLILGCLPGLV